MFSEGMNVIVNYSPFSEPPVQPKCPQITLFLELHWDLKKNEQKKGFTVVNEERFHNLLLSSRSPAGFPGFLGLVIILLVSWVGFDPCGCHVAISVVYF